MRLLVCVGALYLCLWSGGTGVRSGRKPCHLINFSLSSSEMALLCIFQALPGLAVAQHVIYVKTNVHCLDTCSVAFYWGRTPLREARDPGLFPSLEPKLWKENPSHGFTSAEGHTGWWTLVSPRSSPPLSSISRHLESGTELWAKIDTFPCHTEPEFLKTGKPPGLFKLFSTWVWKILFPDRKFDSHFTKSMGTWLNCIIASHKRTLRRNCISRSCPVPVWAESHACFQTPRLLIEQRSMTL